ncbi:unnamed protein product [Schistosoma turkestanicum]|nr:unnamed protein product [Schistosoma turkestanicum]
MWTPPVCDNPPPFNIEKELVPTVISESSSKSSGVSSSSSGLDRDILKNDYPQYTAQNIRYQHYPVPKVRCLSFPYQILPTCGSKVYLYTWTLPRNDIINQLCSLAATCFQDTNMSVGLLFSKPISKVTIFFINICESFLYVLVFLRTLFYLPTWIMRSKIMVALINFILGLVFPSKILLK